MKDFSTRKYMSDADLNRFYEVKDRCSGRCRCGKKICIPEFLDYVVCPYCYKTMYRSDKSRFMVLLKKAIDKVEKECVKNV